jgi:hypothetical protein
LGEQHQSERSDGEAADALRRDGAEETDGAHGVSNVCT